MIAGLRPYPACKDSGIDWLGKVPEHWDVRPAFAVYRPTLEKNTGMKEDTVLSLSYGRIIVKPKEKLHGLVPESFETYQVVNPGDIVIRTTDLQNDHTSLRVGLVRDRGIITSAYLALRTAQVVDPDFGYQFLNVWDLTKAIYGYGSGLRQNLDFGHFKRMPVALPSLPEQAAIVRFLDYMDRRIRRYIRAKQQLIKLFEEQKQVIIHQAVTGQIDVRSGKPYSAYKDSGIEWLSQVPGHWSTLPLKRLVSIDNSGSYGNDAEEGPVVLPVATTAQIGRDGQFHVEKMPFRSFSEQDAMRYGCMPGDILVVKSSGSIFNVVSGKAGIVRDDTPKFVFSNFLLRVIPSLSAVSPEFLFLLLNGYLTRERVKRMVAGTTYPNLRVPEYLSALLPLPPLDEQKEIVSALLAQIAEFDQIITTTQAGIDLLLAYRTRILADVVTGKLDVREAAANLPDEAEDPESLVDETLLSNEDSAEEITEEEAALEEVEI